MDVTEDVPQTRPERTGPLHGLRVVDMTTSYAGPSAAMYLADLGADVIKIERPIFGDDARGWGPPFEGEESAWFASANRNKRSVVIDVSTERGRALLGSLLADAHVFMQNLNPGKLQRLGLDPQTLTALHPHLIYCALSGWGLDGPAFKEPGYDLAAQARSGLMSVTGPTGGAPHRVATAITSSVPGSCAALAVSAAGRTGHSPSSPSTLIPAVMSSIVSTSAALRASHGVPASRCFASVCRSVTSPRWRWRSAP